MNKSFPENDGDIFFLPAIVVGLPIPRRKLAFTSISKLLCDMDLPSISEVAYIFDGS